MEDDKARYYILGSKEKADQYIVGGGSEIKNFEKISKKLKKGVDIVKPKCYNIQAVAARAEAGAP